jgi:hypothetical protein
MTHLFVNANDLSNSHLQVEVDFPSDIYLHLITVKFSGHPRMHSGVADHQHLFTNRQGITVYGESRVFMLLLA